MSIENASRWGRVRKRPKAKNVIKKHSFLVILISLVSKKRKNDNIRRLFDAQMRSEAPKSRKKGDPKIIKKDTEKVSEKHEQ